MAEDLILRSVREWEKAQEHLQRAEERVRSARRAVDMTFLMLRSVLARIEDIPLGSAVVGGTCSASPAQIHLFDDRSSSDRCVFCQGRTVSQTTLD